MTDGQPKPVLWVSCTTSGRSPQEYGGDAKPDEAALEDVRERLEDAGLTEDYQVVVADDKVRLLDAEEIRDLIGELQEYAAQFSHEDALFEAANDGQEDGE